MTGKISTSYRPGHAAKTALLVVLGVLAVTACGSSGNPTDTAVRASLPGVSFDASIRHGVGTIEVSYRLGNDSGQTLLVLNRVPVKEGTAGTDLETEPNEVYITDRGGGLVEVAKRTFDRPDGVELYAPWELETTVLAHGETLEEALSVPLPLRGRSLYPDHDGGLADLPEPVRRVVFCVGVVPPTPSMDVGAHGSVFRTGHGLRGQRLLCSEELDVAAG